MYELKKFGKVFTSKFVGTGPSSYEKKNLPDRGLTMVEKHCYMELIAGENVSSRTIVYDFLLLPYILC